MEDGVERSVQRDVLGDVVEHERKSLPAFQVSEIAAVARQQVVHRDDLVTFREKPLAEVTSEETGASRHEHSHGRPTPV